MPRVRVLAISFSLLLAGYFGAYQVRPDDPVGAGSLRPTLEDKDVGLVGLASGFDLKAYQVVVVDRFPVTDPSIKDEGDRRLASRGYGPCAPRACAYVGSGRSFRGHLRQFGTRSS